MKTNTADTLVKPTAKRGNRVERIERKLAAFDSEQLKRIADRNELFRELNFEKRTEANMSGRAEFLRAVEELDTTKREAVISIVIEGLDDNARRDRIHLWETHLAEDALGSPERNQGEKGHPNVERRSGPTTGSSEKEPEKLVEKEHPNVEKRSGPTTESTEKEPEKPSSTE